jgi:hypothetical protein
MIKKKKKSITWAAIDAVLVVKRKLIELQRKQENNVDNSRDKSCIAHNRSSNRRTN